MTATQPIPITALANLSLAHTIEQVARRALAAQPNVDAALRDLLPPTRWAALLQVLSRQSLENQVLFSYVMARHLGLGEDRKAACRGCLTAYFPLGIYNGMEQKVPTADTCRHRYQRLLTELYLTEKQMQ